MQEKFLDFWKKNNINKGIVILSGSIVLFFIFKLFKGIGNNSNNESTPVTNSKLSYGSVGTNTDTGYLNNDVIDTVNENIEKIQNNQNTLYDYIETIQSNVNDIDEEVTQKVSKQSTMDKIYDFFDLMQKYKQGYTNSKTDTDKQNYSNMGKNLRDTAMNYAKKNGLDLQVVDTGQGYNEIIIEGVQI